MGAADTAKHPPQFFIKPVPQQPGAHLNLNSRKGRTRGSASVLGQAGASPASRPSFGHSASTGQAPQFSVSHIRHGDSTCTVQQKHKGPGAAWCGWARLSVHIHTACFTHCRLPHRRASVNFPTSPSPGWKRAVKERGWDQAAAPGRSAVLRPKAPVSPQLVAVVLDDNLQPMVPQLSS